MFSETIDIVVSRSNRVDRVADIAQYVNATIRSMHVFKPWSSDLQNVVLHPHIGDSYSYLNHGQHPHHHPHQTIVLASHRRHAHGGHDFGYDVVSARRGLHTPSTQYKWALPEQFNKIRAVRYDDDCVVPNIDPSLRQSKLKSYYYILGLECIFRGFSRHIELWYYTWSPNLNYFQVGRRPAIWDRGISQWSYLNLLGDAYVPNAASPGVERMARVNSGNWILRDWQQVVVDGALMRLYRASEDPRSKAHEQAFREGLFEMQRSIGENAEQGGYSN